MIWPIFLNLKISEEFYLGWHFVGQTARKNEFLQESIWVWIPHMGPHKKHGHVHHRRRKVTKIKVPNQTLAITISSIVGKSKHDVYPLYKILQLGLPHLSSFCCMMTHLQPGSHTRSMCSHYLLPWFDLRFSHRTYTCRIMFVQVRWPARLTGHHNELSWLGHGDSYPWLPTWQCK